MTRALHIVWVIAAAVSVPALAWSQSQAQAASRSASTSIDTVRDSDSAHPRLIPGRKKHDSVAFASTVAFGRHQMKIWPAAPAPLPGSILPANRIVAFYGNPLSKR